MASTVTEITNQIDVNFPVFGQALSSVQEFQQNFQKIQKGFESLSKEITILQKNAVKLQDINDFGYNVVNKAVLQNHSYSVNTLGLIGNGVIDLDYSLGYYHTCSVNSGYYTFNVTNWPIGNAYSKIRLAVENASTSTTATCYINFSGNISYLNTQTNKITLGTESYSFWDLWSTDNGDSIFIKKLGSTLSTSTISIPGGGGGPSGTPPLITSVYPASASIYEPHAIYVSGTNMTGTNLRVYFNDIQITASFGEVSASSIIFIVSSVNLGPNIVKITTENGESTNIDVTGFDSSGGP